MNAKKPKKTGELQFVELSPDSLSIEFLYEEFFHYSTSFIRKNGGTLDDAKEMFQEAILILLSRLIDNKFCIEQSLKSYISAVVRNLWIKTTKKRKKTALIVDDPDAGFDVEDESSDIYSKLEEEELKRQYLKYMNALGERSREAILPKIGGKPFR